MQPQHLDCHLCPVYQRRLLTCEILFTSLSTLSYVALDCISLPLVQRYARQIQTKELS